MLLLEEEEEIGAGLCRHGYPRIVSEVEKPGIPASLFLVVVTVW